MHTRGEVVELLIRSRFSVSTENSVIVERMTGLMVSPVEVENGLNSENPNVEVSQPFDDERSAADSSERLDLALRSAEIVQFPSRCEHIRA